MPQMKVGQMIIEMLRAENCEYTFGVVGTTTNSIVTEMYGRSDIHFVDTRHEEGAAFMAYGYARASGKPTACITTSGPGTINLVRQSSLSPEMWRVITSTVMATRRLTWSTCSSR
jgi:acetolactate synthase-1/2/3 large subunit